LADAEAVQSDFAREPRLLMNVNPARNQLLGNIGESDQRRLVVVASRDEHAVRAILPLAKGRVAWKVPHAQRGFLNMHQGGTNQPIAEVIARL